MMNGSTRERLARKQLGKAGAQSSVIPDPLHNLDKPCCLLMQEAVLDILPESSQEKDAAEEPSILGRIVKQHLQTAAVSTATSASSNSAKKKRKRKKKKKATQGDATVASEGKIQGTVEEGNSTEGPSEQPSPKAEESGTQLAPPPPAPAAPQQTPPPPPSSSTPATPDLVQKWLQRTSTDDASIVKNRDLSCFLQHISDLDVSLEYRAAREAVDAIACPACKQVVESYFRARCDSSLPVSAENMETEAAASGLQIPGSFADESIENAFDYFAMEEGTEQHSDTLLTLKRVDSLLKSNTSISLEQCESIMRDMILSQGLSPEQQVDSVYETDIHDLSDVLEEDFNRIMEEVKQEEEKMTGMFRNFELNHATLRAQIEGVEMAGAFDVKGPAILMDSDTVFDEALFQMLMIVRRLSNQHYRSSFRQEQDVLEQVEAMYVLVFEAVETMVHAQLAHTARVVQLAQRPGSVPQMVVCARHRTSFQSLLIAKVTALQKLRHGLKSILLDRFLCRIIWAEVHLDGLCYPSPETTEIDGFEEFWNTSVVMTKTIPGVNTSDLKKKQLNNAKEWMDAIVATKESLPSQNSIPTGHEESYTSHLQSASGRFAILEREEDEDAREEGIPQFVNDISFMFKSVLSQTFHTRRETEVFTYDGRLDVPLKMKRFMHGQENSKSSADGPCEGGGGRRRTTGILVGLFYRWLKDRCNEWHAELTQKELLESMTDEPFEDIKAPKSKKSKKKRSKEKKSLNPAVMVGKEEIATASVEVVRPVESMDVPNDDVHKSNGKDVGTGKPNVSNDSVDRRPEVVSSPNVIEEKSPEKDVASTDNSARVSGVADTWAEWRADLTETGLLDTIPDEGSSPVKRVEEEFKVAESKKTKKKRDKEKQVAPAPILSGEQVITPAKVPDSSKVARTVVDSRANAADKRPDDSRKSNTKSKGNKSSDKSKENVEHIKQSGKTANGKESRVNKPEPPQTKETPFPQPPKVNDYDATEGDAETKERKSGQLKTKSGKAAHKTANPKPDKRSTIIDELDRDTGKEPPEPELDSRKSPRRTPQKRFASVAPTVEVGVVSLTGFQSAEGFLVERLVEALKADEEK